MPSLLYIGTPPLGRQAKGVLSYPPPFIRGKRASPLPKEDHLSEMISGEDGKAPERPFSGPFPGFHAPAGLRASPRSGRLLTVRKEEVVQKQGESFRGLVDREVFKVQDAKVNSVKGYPIDATYGKLLKKPEDYTDVRALVVADLQDELERIWIADLRKQYPVVVNTEILKTVNNHE